VQSVARAASLLDLVGIAGNGGMGVTEIAGHLKVAKSTALSLARTLSAAGLLRAVHPGPRYVLGLNLLRLGDLVGQQTSFDSATNGLRSPGLACPHCANVRVRPV